MAGSGFDGTIVLNESFRFIDFHPINDAKKHIAIPTKSIVALWTDEDGCWISYSITGPDGNADEECTISPSEYKTICQRLGISDVNQ